MDEIEELRKEIDLINQSILSALNLRQMNVIKILRLKHAKGRPLRDPEREEQMLNKVTLTNTGPISSETVRDVFRAIFKHTVDDIKL